LIYLAQDLGAQDVKSLKKGSRITGEVAKLFSDEASTGVLKANVARRRLLSGGALLATLAAKPGWALPSASTVRVADRGNFTRFVLDISEEAPFSLFTLARPYRVVVDLPEIRFADFDVNAPRAAGLVRDFRYGLFEPGHSRLVLDLTGPSAIAKAFILPPGKNGYWRLVIDLEKTSEQAFLGLQGAKNRIGGPAPKSPAIVKKVKEPEAQKVAVINEQGVPQPGRKPGGPVAPPGTPRPEKKPKHLSGRKPVIVLDPGHGGVDPGAIGVSGVHEKTITLAAARELKKQLEKTGKVKVVLTRERDIFVRLKQRVNIARRAKADLFISLHADSFKERKVRGLSVYTLSERASDREAAALADKENKADLIAGIDLTHESQDVLNILIDLAQRESLNLAAKLASSLVKELKRVAKLKRDTHRFAGFAVLKAPDIPSVLIEMGYLSNAQEEKALRQRSYRGKIATAVVNAVSVYLRTNGK